MEKKKRIEKIISLCEENEITAYKIGSHTGLNTSNLQKILDKEVANPRLQTIKKIEEFLDNWIYKKRSHIVGESPVNYNENLTVEEKIAESVLEKIEPLFDDLKRFINRKINK